MNWTFILVLALLVTVGVLGHSIWHAEVVTVFNWITYLFTGTSVSGCTGFSC